MSPLEEAPSIVGHGINVHGLAALGIAAIAAVVGWKILQRLTNTN